MRDGSDYSAGPDGRPSRIRTFGRWLLDPGQALSSRVLHAGLWAFGMSLTLRLIATTRTFALGNLLDPSDFGLAAVATLVTGLVETTSQIGIQQALVQRQGSVTGHLDTAWTMQVARGVGLALILVAAAPFVAAFYDTPQVIPMIWVLAGGVIIFELRNIGVMYFEKDLTFRKDFQYRLGGQLINLVFAVVVAAVYRSAWALIIGIFAKRVFDTVASYVIHSYRPRFRWDPIAARDIFRFGRWFMLSSVLVYLVLNLDDLVVGRVVGVAALGLYTMAFSISQLATTEITKVISRVAFPTYSIVQDQQQQLHAAYTHTLQIVALLAVPGTLGLAVVGSAAVELLIGAKWLPMMPAFQVLLIWGLIRSLLGTTGPLFEGIGRPYINTTFQAFQVVTIALLIYPLTVSAGIVGAAWATVIAAILPSATALRLALKAVGGSVRDLVRAIGFPIAHTGVMGSMLLGLGAIWPTEPSWTWLVTAISLGVVTYVLSVAVSRRFFGYLPHGLTPNLDDT